MGSLLTSPDEAAHISRALVIKTKKSDGVTDVLVPNWAAIEAQPTDSRQRFPGRLPPQRRQPLPAV